MRIQPLYDLQQEINRLFIAGSKFAKGDPRLQKHIAVLSKLGEKAPVFKKMATDIEDLIQADTQESAEKLMNLSNLLYAVLYTQGEFTVEEAEVTTQQPSLAISEISTTYSYLQLKPVIEALTISNSGRLEVLKDAFERNLFQDSRTFQYLNIALADKYSELCEYVEETIIPSIGKPMLYFLLEGFKYEDKTEQVRRLRLLALLGYSDLQTVIDTIMAESLPALQAEAITILSADAKHEPLIISLAEDKNKLVREAVYQALAVLNTQSSLEKLKDVYVKNTKNKTNLQLVTKALSTSSMPFFFAEVMDQVVGAFETLIALDQETEDKKVGEAVERFILHLDVLKEKGQPEVFAFLAQVITNKQLGIVLTAKKAFLNYSVSNLFFAIEACLKTYDKAQVLEFYEQHIHRAFSSEYQSRWWFDYMEVAVQFYTPEKVYDIFGPRFGKDKALITPTALFHVYTDVYGYHYQNTEAIQVTGDKIDRRWIPLLFGYFDGKIRWDNTYNEVLLLLHTVEPINKELDKLLKELTLQIAPEEQITIFELLMERQVKDRFEVIYKAMDRFPKNSYYYALYRLMNNGFWTQFPKEYAPKFKEMFEKKKVDIYNQIAEEIAK